MSVASDCLFDPQTLSKHRYAVKLGDCDSIYVEFECSRCDGKAVMERAWLRVLLTTKNERVRKRLLRDLVVGDSCWVRQQSRAGS